MSDKTHETFSEWFDVFQEECQQQGYSGPIMSDTFKGDYEEGKCPHKVAEEFVKEMND